MSNRPPIEGQGTQLRNHSSHDFLSGKSGRPPCFASCFTLHRRLTSSAEIRRGDKVSSTVYLGALSLETNNEPEESVS